MLILNFPWFESETSYVIQHFIISRFQLHLPPGTFFVIGSIYGINFLFQILDLPNLEKKNNKKAKPDYYQHFRILSLPLKLDSPLRLAFENSFCKQICNCQIITLVRIGNASLSDLGKFLYATYTK